MSVESYLDSIRKNTISNADKTASLNNTIKDLLNYESLKKAVSAGVEKGNREQFKRLAELSKKILLTSDATNAELKETNKLLKLFYAQIPKDSAGNTQVTADSWVKALKEVLDEFGDSLPQKFQNRLKYDIVSAAAEGGADPKAVFQQLNMTQINQTVILQNIYDGMIERQKLIDRKAEALKPIENDEKRKQSNFWETRLGKVISTLSGILDKMSKAAQWLSLIYVGLAIWNDLADPIKSALRSLSAINITARISSIISRLFKGSEISKFVRSLNPSRIFSGLGSKIKGLFEGSAVPKLEGSGQMSFISKIEGFFARIRALTSYAIKNVVPPTSKILKELFPTFSKILNWIKNVGASAISLYKKLAPGFKLFMKGIQTGLSKFGGLLKLLAPAIKVGSSFLKFIPVAGWILQGIISLGDFIQGFINTRGSLIDKIKGGFKRVGVEFVAVFGDLAVWTLKHLTLLIENIAKKIPGLWDITQPLLGGLGKTITGLRNSLSNMRSGIGYESTSSSSSSSGIYEPSTGTFYMGSDALSAAMPLSSHVAGSSPTSASGVNKSAGVQLSSQAADFYKRAGLSNRVTSGMEGKHAGTASNPRSHYSGNKFDLDISTTSAAAFANEVRKMLRTPGLVEIRTESVPAWVVEGARKILKAEGYNTSKLINDGYPSYSTGPHLDVLIDPKYSGVPATSTGLTTSMETLDSAAATGDLTPSNPLLADMTKNLTKAFNEQIKLFDKGAKAPNQLASSQSRAATTAITNQLAAKSSGNAVTFNKKSDIQDDSLAALRLLNLA